MNRASSILAAKLGSIQAIHLDRVAAFSRRLDRLLATELRTMVDDMHGQINPSLRAVSVSTRLRYRIASLMREWIESTAMWQWQASRAAFVASVPLKVLRAISPIPAEAVILEDTRTAAIKVDPRTGKAKLAKPKKLPKKLSAEQARDAYAAILFPVLSQDRLRGYLTSPIGSGPSWEDAVARMTSLASPAKIVSAVLLGRSRGDSTREIADSLMSVVGGVRSTANRLARDTTRYLSHRIDQDLWAGAGELVIGYQIHATLDERTRPEHRHRNGKIWLKDSGESMEKALEMEAPYLPDDYNCRCWLSPVLKPPTHLTGNQEVMAEFEASRGDVVPDPATFSEWFASASERLQRLSVGSRRYQTVSDLVESPGYEHFVDADGRLMAIEELEAESEDERSARVESVRQLMLKRRADIERVALFGF